VTTVQRIVTTSESDSNF